MSVDYIMRNGRRIDVETDRPKERQRAFAQVPLDWAARAAKATNTPKALVWVWLAFLAWEKKSSTFKVPNERLSELGGFSRWTKTRALRELEADGVIKVDWRDRKSPVVTLLDFPLKGKVMWTGKRRAAA